MKNVTVIGGFALNSLALDFLKNITTYNYVDINHFSSTMSIKNMVDTIDTQLNSTNNLLIAYSMGGLIAIDLAIKNPDKFTHIILLNSTPCFMEKENWQGISEIGFRKLQKKLELANIDDFYKYFISLITYPEKLSAEYQKLMSDTTVEQLNNLLNILYTIDYRHKFLEIQKKCTLINTQNDVLIKVNGLDCQYMENCSHLNITNSQEMISEILQRYA